MKKFYVLLKKEIKELLTIQMLAPLVFTAVLFVVIGNIIGAETSKKPVIKMAVLNQDNSEISKEAIEALRLANIEPVVYNGNPDFSEYKFHNPSSFEIDPMIIPQLPISLNEAIDKAKKENCGALMIIPKEFGEAAQNFKPQSLEVRYFINSFSLLGTQNMGAYRAGIAAVNEKISDILLKQATGNVDPAVLKHPVAAKDFVIMKGKEVSGSPEEILGAVSKQMTFIPIILFLVIVLASQMIATAVATEKENKTLETLLSAPVSRQSIVYAKLAGAGLVSLLLVAMYMFGFRYYMNGLSGGALNAPITPAASAALKQLGLAFSPGGYALLGASLFLGIVSALAVAMILGAFAESAKAAQGVITPLMILVALPYFAVMFLDMEKAAPYLKYIIYAIPFSHPFLVSNNILLGKGAAIIYEIVYQFICLIIFVFIASKIFSSDKILTMKLNFRRKR